MTIFERKNLRVNLAYMKAQYYNWKLTLTTIFPVDPELDYWEEELVRINTVYDC